MSGVQPRLIRRLPTDGAGRRSARTDETKPAHSYMMIGLKQFVGLGIEEGAARPNPQLSTDPGQVRIAGGPVVGIEYIRERHMASIVLGARDTGSKKQVSTEAPRQGSIRTSRLTRPSAKTLDAELARVVTALKEGVAHQDLSNFYQTLRATHLPSIVDFYSRDPRGLARACFNILHSIGSISPAVGVAIENHYYVLATLTTLPIRKNPELAARRQSLLQKVVQERLLLANTSFRPACP